MATEKKTEHQRFEEDDFSNEEIGDFISELEGTPARNVTVADVESGPAPGEEEEPEVEETEEPSGKEETESEPEEGEPDPEDEDEDEEEVSAEGEPEPEPEPEPSELELLRAQNEKLMELLNRSDAPLEAQPAPAQAAEPSQPREEQPARPAFARAVAPPTLTDELFDNIRDDREAFENYMTERDAAVAQSTVAAIAPVFKKAIREHLSIHEFFQSRPEFAKARPLIEREALRVQREHPDMETLDVVRKAAEELKEVLITHKEEKRNENGEILRRRSKERPASKRLAAPRSRRGPAPAQTGGKKGEQSIADQIDALAEI